MEQVESFAERRLRMGYGALADTAITIDERTKVISFEKNKSQEENRTNVLDLQKEDPTEYLNRVEQGFKAAIAFNCLTGEIEKRAEE